MQKIYYDDTGCGNGKTYNALQTIIKQGGRHLYVADRIDAINERARSLQRMMGDESDIHIDRIFAEHDHRGVGASVAGRIDEVPSRYANQPNVVVFITHEALKLANFESFAGQGWSVWIDEVPNILDHDKHLFCLAWEKLADFYDLIPTGDGDWSRVAIRNSGVDVAALAQDDAFQLLRAFHRRVADPRRKVLVNLTDWVELREKRREMSWFSVWSPDELTHFDAVFMLGNALLNSVTARLWQEHWPEVQWEPLSSPLRPFQARRVFITYFAENHRASRSLFSSQQGKANLKKIAEHLDLHCGHDLIWTCNHADQATLAGMPGTKLSPKMAGSNSYSGFPNVAALYSAKPDDSQRVVLRKLGLDPQHHTETAEFETILQFICRGSIRIPDDQRDFRIFVYDKAQAHYLLAYFQDRAPYVLWPQADLYNLGFAYDIRTSKRGRKPTKLTAAEKAEREQRRREEDRLRKQRKRAELKRAA